MPGSDMSAGCLQVQQLLFPGAPNAKGKDQLPLERTFKVCLVISEAASVPPDFHEPGPRFSTVYFAEAACAGLLACVQQQTCHAQVPPHALVDTGRLAACQVKLRAPGLTQAFACAGAECCGVH